MLINLFWTKFAKYLHVVGKTMTTHVIDKAAGRFCRPTTSAVTGATVGQNVPATVPPIKA